MTDESLTNKPSYTVIDNDTLMVEQTINEQRRLIHIFNFNSWQISIIYETRAPAGGGKYGNHGENISTSMNTVDYTTLNTNAQSYMKNMHEKLIELNKLAAQQAAESTPERYESVPTLES